MACINNALMPSIFTQEESDFKLCKIPEHKTHHIESQIGGLAYKQGWFPLHKFWKARLI